MNANSTSKQDTVTSRDGTKTITAEEFERLFDDGSDEIDDYIDHASARLDPPRFKRVNVDFAPQMVLDLDRVAAARGVTRQALIKMWLADKLDEHHRTRPAAE